MTAHAKTILGECPFCRVTTQHAHIGSDIYRCHVCGRTCFAGDIRVREDNPQVEAKQKGLFDGDNENEG
jgi:ribosomal protein L37AE/L43A